MKARCHLSVGTGGVTPVCSSEIEKGTGDCGCRAVTTCSATAVGPLAAADPGRCALARRRLVEAEVVAQEDVLRVDRHVGLELALPVAVRLLQREQVVDRARQRDAGGADRAVAGEDGHATATF